MKRGAAILLASTLFLAGCTAAPRTREVPAGADGRALKISESVTAGNLSIVFLQGPDTIAAEWSTLEELARPGGSRIGEIEGGGSVPFLQVENAGGKPAYLQAGEPLKGGQQDRILSCDSVVPPGAGGRVPVYCIERQRWGGAGGFGDGGPVRFIAPTRALKYIVQHKLRSQQSEVWDEVRRTKQKAVQALQLDGSRTSSLNEELESVLTQGSFTRLAAWALSRPIPEDAVGVLFAIDGEVTHFDLYATHALFLQQHRKLAHSAVLEALLEPGGKGRTVDDDSLRAWLASALSTLDPARARVAYEGGLPQFEAIDVGGARSVFGYLQGSTWVHVQGIAYVMRDERARRGE